MLSHRLEAQTLPKREVPLEENIELYRSVHLSQVGLKKSDAKKIVDEVADKKISPFKLETKKYGVNPSLEFCAHLTGTPSTHKSRDGDEIATCTFKDKSYLYTWDALSILKN